jgi:methionine-S-sulfoxide reductase
MKTIYFAGGCFWGTEHYMSQFEGVVETVVGYANGNVADPAYEEVYTDKTGHVECVKVVYDDEMISLATLCRLFFRSIDPLLLNRQGGDIGTRYRTGIYWNDTDDQAVVEEVYAEIQRKYNEPLVVEKSPLKCFYSAEEYHQKYLVKNPEGYCHLSLSTLKSATSYSRIINELRAYSDDEKKAVLPRFFKTGKGEYGEGDRFLGVIVPNTRKVAKNHKDSPYIVIEMLLESEWHECRLCALLMLIEKYRKEPDLVVQFYLTHTKGINNWDLVDLSAPYILGDFLKDKTDRNVLYDLAGSAVMWERRIAVVSTLMLIRDGQLDDTFRLAEMLIDSRHDLMQKSIGWMLREAGKRDEERLVRFLENHRHEMPRTMLRYAIEKFPEPERREFMRKG